VSLSEYKVEIISLLLTIGIRSLLLLHTVRFRKEGRQIKPKPTVNYEQRVSLNFFMEYPTSNILLMHHHTMEISKARGAWAYYPLKQFVHLAHLT